MKIGKNVAELVGNTPLLLVNTITKGLKAKVVVKMESANPLFCVKDRLAVAMIEDAEKKGLIDSDTVIVEPTSGNTGIGLASICASRGYELVLTMPDTMSLERRKLLKIFGAKLVLTPGARGMTGAVAEAKKIVEETENAFMPQQFENPVNAKMHENTTAVEIWEDTDGEVDVFVGGVGTGGTVTGVGRGLKSRNKDIKIVAVEPAESPVLSGGKPGPHKIQGIGAGFIPGVMDLSIVDEIVTASAEQAKVMAGRLAKEEGILVGISSGAAMHAAVELAKREENEGKTIVAVLPDTGERYLSTWLFDEV